MVRPLSAYTTFIHEELRDVLLVTPAFVQPVLTAAAYAAPILVPCQKGQPLRHRHAAPVIEAASSIIEDHVVDVMTCCAAVEAPAPPVPQLSSDMRWEVWERDDFRCRHCGSRRDLTVDHIHPRALGGTNAPDNLQTLCRPCNSTKGARIS